jgi:hypothetical protein
MFTSITHTPDRSSPSISISIKHEAVILAIVLYMQMHIQRSPSRLILLVHVLLHPVARRTLYKLLHAAATRTPCAVLLCCLPTCLFLLLRLVLASG